MRRSTAHPLRPEDGARAERPVPGQHGGQCARRDRRGGGFGTRGGAVPRPRGRAGVHHDDAVRGRPCRRPVHKRTARLATLASLARLTVPQDRRHYDRHLSTDALSVHRSTISHDGGLEGPLATGQPHPRVLRRFTSSIAARWVGTCRVRCAFGSRSVRAGWRRVGRRASQCGGAADRVLRGGRRLARRTASCAADGAGA
jgi:hypothetical protein